ncbi:MAG TPA: hypothetical protein VG826_33470 [Pirellulales bacterium]|nr:hypothetical protein [Pirellulales bacterium]
MSRRFQFNIRALLCVTFVIACWLAGYAYKLREAQRLQREIDNIREHEREKARLQRVTQE